MSWRTVLGTILTLTAMQAVLSSKAAAGRVGNVFQGLGVATAYVLSPAYPLVPDLRLDPNKRPMPQPAPTITPPSETPEQGFENPLTGTVEGT